MRAAFRPARMRPECSRAYDDQKGRPASSDEGCQQNSYTRLAIAAQPLVCINPLINARCFINPRCTR